jgi:hypothetical protein
MNDGGTFDPLPRSQSSAWPTAAEIVESRPALEGTPRVPVHRQWLSFARECGRCVMAPIRKLVTRDR